MATETMDWFDKAFAGEWATDQRGTLHRMPDLTGSTDYLGIPCVNVGLSVEPTDYVYDGKRAVSAQLTINLGEEYMLYDGDQACNLLDVIVAVLKTGLNPGRLGRLLDEQPDEESRAALLEKLAALRILPKCETCGNPAIELGERYCRYCKQDGL